MTRFQLMSRRDSNAFPGEDVGRRLLGRPVHGDLRSDDVLKQIVGWMDECVNTHEKCGAWSEPTTLFPSRVIDIGVDDTREPFLREFLQSERQVGRYMTLSHLWG